MDWPFLALFAASLMLATIAGFAGSMIAYRQIRSEFRRLDADLDDAFERIESAQKRAASRARRAAPEDDEAQQSIPGVADPKLKARIRAAWLQRKA
jgi:hypothetical protein